MSPRPPPPGAPLAAIDIGSNSFRLEIGQLQHGRYRRIAYLKETVRLGGGLDSNGYLTEDSAQRGLDCLARFAQRLAGFEPGQVRAVATQTLREARNRNAFLLRGEAALGHPIEVISGREEARLIYAGVSHLQPSDAPRLVIDIGGRSTEMIVGQGRVPKVTESFRVGSVSLSMRWFPDGRYTEQRFRDAQVAAGAELEEALAPFAPEHWREALGSSGTAGAVSQILAAAGRSDGTITPDGLRWCIGQCLAAGSVSKLNLPSLREDRKAILGGGLALLYTLATHFGITELKPAKGALRQGVIVDLAERHNALRQADGAHDMRDISSAELQRRFQVDVAQAQRVREVATSLLLQALPDIDAESLRELGWACDLHELGLMVSHHDHHRHSAYLLSHVDAPGFSQSQQRRIADLVLAQRGGLRKSEAQLASELFAWQVLALRLAVIKCHARDAVDGHALHLKRDGRQARLGWTRLWAEAHPRTLHLLREEAEAWVRQTPRLVLALA
ncbi:Ppx/GppA phosphatase family protein [Aquabacterium sp. OR-4]|uniref:Ppx/GppA phosphatase family protein n=1 Tax=Aquabacterium sp. OR-4 TaxID=2978127 RepID=UPI0021B17B4A|nr:Ppx/GppA phosphatase family protein [Aquabacterium sp. OR-4]MDT7836375.1 Ppx/GppA phosphatase family protein [Aquabacterium sp. OR-4]